MVSSSDHRGGGGARRATSGSSGGTLDVGEELYVGGVPGYMYASLPDGVRSSDGFQGCMASVDLNGNALTLTERMVELKEELRDVVRHGCEGTIMLIVFINVSIKCLIFSNS